MSLGGHRGYSGPEEAENCGRRNGGNAILESWKRSDAIPWGFTRGIGP